MYQKKEKNCLQKMSPHLSQLNVAIAHRNYLSKIICKSSNWQHIQRLKITILGANWQLFRLERIAKCSYFILSTQNIKFYWFVMKIKKFLLPIWWYHRGSFPLGNKYFGVFVLNGFKELIKRLSNLQLEKQTNSKETQTLLSDSITKSTCMIKYNLYLTNNPDQTPITFRIFGKVIPYTLVYKNRPLVYFCFYHIDVWIGSILKNTNFYFYHQNVQST